MRVRVLRRRDWPAVAEIYAAGIATGEASFETSPPGWERFDATRHRHLRLVAVDGPDTTGTVLGWAAAAPVSERAVYAGVAEHSVYVAPHAQGRGVGRRLLRELVAACESDGIWTLQSGVFPDNAASVALHEAVGFRVVGRRERLARHRGAWRDVLLMERRSLRVGGDGPLVRSATDDDVEAVASLLARCALPLAGLGDAWRLWVAEDGGDVIGCVALEHHAADGDDGAFLLRSLAVRSDQRGLGLGERLVSAALAAADLHGGATATVGLLTETASGYVERFGFEATARADLPAELAGSAEFRGACPDTARAYLRSA